MTSRASCRVTFEAELAAAEVVMAVLKVAVMVAEMAMTEVKVVAVIEVAVVAEVDALAGRRRRERSLTGRLQTALLKLASAPSDLQRLPQTRAVPAGASVAVSRRLPRPRAAARSQQPP